jgi:glycosyltransferase involved in cell wall biosynthesis
MFHHTGIGVYIRQLLPHLFDLRPDWTFRLIATEDFAPDFALPSNCEVVTARSDIYTLREQIEIPRLAGPDCDFLWVPHYNIPLRAKVPLLVTVHDVAHLALPEFKRIPQKRLYARIMFNAVRERAQHVFFVSDFSRHEFERLIGAPAGTVSLSRNSIDPEWFQPVPPLPAAQDEDYAVFVGNFKPHKNLIGTIKACQDIREKRPLKLIVVAHLSNLKRASSELTKLLAANRDWIYITDRLPDNELRQMVAGARMLVYPSTYEGFGIPPLEAMAVSCPTVVSDIEATREACGDASLFVDPYDPASIAGAMRQILENDTVRGNLLRKGLKQVQLYDSRSTARDIIAAMEAIAAPARGRRLPERRVA